MLDRLFSFVVRRPWWTVLLSIALIVFAAFGAGNLVFKSDYRVYFSDENPQLIAYESIQKIYSKSDNVAFIIVPEDGNVFTQESLDIVNGLTTEAWQIPYSTRVDSITNFQHTWSEEDDMIVEDLVFEDTVLSEEDLQRVREIAISEPLLVNKLISERGHVTVVNVTVQLPEIDPVAEVPEVVTKVREIQQRYEAEHPGLKIQLSGVVMMNNTFAESVLNDNANLVPIMFAVVVATMLFLLRTFSGTFATVIIIIASIATALGLAGWSGMYLSGPSASSPTMILTLAVADCIHILSTMFYEMRQGRSKQQAILESLRVNFQPIMLTSVTTAIGFLSMNFSDSPPFHDLGNTVAAGVMLAFVFSITLFPALLMVLPVKVQVRDENDRDWTRSLANFVTQRRNILLPVMSLVMIGLIALLPQNRLNDDFVKYFDTSVPFRQATDFMQENLSGLTQLEISIESGESGGINDPLYIQRLGAFSQWLNEQPETDHVITLSDTLKRLNKNMHGDDPSYYTLPEDRELSAQYLLLYEMSLPYGLDLNNQLNVDKSSVRVTATFDNITSNEMVALEKRIQGWFEQHAPEYSVQITGPNLMFAHISQRNIESMLSGIALALVLISLLLALPCARCGLVLSRCCLIWLRRRWVSVFGI